MSQREQARRLARAIREGAEDAVRREGPSTVSAVVASWSGESRFLLEVRGLDLDLDQDDVTFAQSVRSYIKKPGVQVGDAMVLVEVDEGDYLAIAVESDSEVLGAEGEPGPPGEPGPAGPAGPAGAPGIGLIGPVDAALTTALPASTYDNGNAGVGATLTADANGALPAIDGVTPYVGMRVLIAGQ